MTRSPARGAWRALLPALALLLAPPVDGGRGARRDRQPHPDAAEGVARPAAEPGRLIVKYRDSVEWCVHCLLASGRGFAPAVAEGGERLDAVHRRHGVHAARPLFRTAEGERGAFPDAELVATADLRRLSQRRLAEILELFPERAARARPDLPLPALHHVYVVELDTGADLFAAAAELAADPHVEYAQPDYRMGLHHEPNDPFYGSAGSWGQAYDDLWGLKRGQLDAARAWDVTRGDGVVVAVVDTGIDFGHEDLAGNTWKNPREIAGNGIDDDRNGYVDDVRGWDTTTCQTYGTRKCKVRKSPDADPSDDHFHGTHVAGTIAAVGDNARGIVGVAPRAKVMAVKALNHQGGGETSDLAEAIVYAAANGADVMNNSWGCGYCPEMPAFEDAVATAAGLGTVVVFSAGNSRRDNRAAIPQNMRDPKPIVVAANDPEDRPTFFTSVGTAVDVTAPGGSWEWGDDGNILSLRFKGKCRKCNRVSVGRKYMRLQGTSMAAPHVAGAAALVLAQRPEMTVDQVRQVLRASSEDVGPEGFDLTSGAGRLDAARALEVAAPLTVEIASPRHGSRVRGARIAIRGTAAGPGFDNYQLFSGTDGEEGWRPLGGPVFRPAAGGSLGGWRGGELAPGWNLLRLVATAADGRRYEDVVSVARQGRPRRIAPELPGLAAWPVISDGLVAWFQVEEPVKELLGHVYLYDLKRKRLLRLTDERVKHSTPSVSGLRVAWDDEADDRTLRPVRTCVYDPATASCPMTQLTPRGGKPRLAGDRIVWVDDERGLVAMDLTGIRQIAISGRANYFDFDGRTVALSSYPFESEYDDVLEVFDVETETRRRIGAHNRILDVAITEGTVLFVSLDRGTNGPQLRAYDLASDEERVLVERLPVVSHLAASGGQVLWSERTDVRMFDLATGRREGAVALPLVIRSAPAISGREVAWIDVQDFDWGFGHLQVVRLPRR